MVVPESYLVFTRSDLSFFDNSPKLASVDVLQIIRRGMFARGFIVSVVLRPS